MLLLVHIEWLRTFPLPYGASGAIFGYICIKFSVTVYFLMLDVKEPKL